MNFVSEVIADKGDRVHSIHPTATVLDAVREMAARQVGSLVVLRNGALIGVITERDYARRGVLHGRRSDETLVETIMTPNPLTVKPTMSVDVCMEIMTDQRVRHLPVMDDHRLIGLVSIGDLVRAIIQRQRETIEQLREYIAS